MGGATPLMPVGRSVQRSNCPPGSCPRNRSSSVRQAVVPLVRWRRCRWRSLSNFFNYEYSSIGRYVEPVHHERRRAVCASCNIMLMSASRLVRDGHECRTCNEGLFVWRNTAGCVWVYWSSYDSTPTSRCSACSMAVTTATYHTWSSTKYRRYCAMPWCITSRRPSTWSMPCWPCTGQS